MRNRLRGFGLDRDGRHDLARVLDLIRDALKSCAEEGAVALSIEDVALPDGMPGGALHQRLVIASIGRRGIVACSSCAVWLSRVTIPLRGGRADV